MADRQLVDRQSALQKILQFARHDDEQAAIVLQARQDLSIAQLSVWPQRNNELAQSLATHFNLSLPTQPGIASSSAKTTLFWIGPEHYWLVSVEDDLCARLRQQIDTTLAVVSDLSHARNAVRISGVEVRAVLAKGLPIDLHERVFPLESAALSAVHGMDVLVHRCAENSFDLYATRSYAVDFWHWLSQAATEFGFVVMD